jgi:hypothetical protein
MRDKYYESIFQITPKRILKNPVWNLVTWRELSYQQKTDLRSQGREYGEYLEQSLDDNTESLFLKIFPQQVLGQIKSIL